MANNYWLATVDPTIPNDLMTPLEKAYLGAIMKMEKADDHEDGAYLYIEEELGSSMSLDNGVLATIKTEDSELARTMREEVKELSEDDELHIDFLDHERVLQAIVARSAGRLTHVAIEGAFTCSKMRRGEFGGYATLITATDIKRVGTSNWLRDEIAALKE